ncbi:MAG: hypothetical protein EOM37_08955 [Proteobacteria bacterium]|jgi:hemerythrin|nr:bacteriohemerythrin [Alphaproteobacteria bacterium]NCC04154.1 hypothetical protein [Pseudomonadota bacterium]
MAFLEWNDSLSVQSPLFDAEHRRLMEHLNILYGFLGQQDSAGFDKALRQLLEATKSHFLHEETLMRKTAYPSYIPHKIAHDRFYAQIDDFSKRVMAHQTTLTDEMAVFLRTSLCEHIMTVDKGLCEWLIKNDLLSSGED